MSSTVLPREVDPYRLGHGEGRAERQPRAEHAERGPASKRIIAGYGFWIFLLSDIVMFAAFFAAFAVLHDATDGGPTAQQVFDLRNVAVETGLLLVSSYTCGIASIGAARRNRPMFLAGMTATFLLGTGFLALEVKEFHGLVAQGAGPDRSAFLSSFFALVGLHGLHITCGLLWLLTMVAQAITRGYRADILRRLLCFSLFWHALDIVWVAIFSAVYLIGTVA